MKRNPETLALAMDYAAAMEAASAYCTVTQPSIRTPEDAARLLRPLIHAATSGNAQESFFVLLLNVKNRPAAAPVECTRGLLDQCPVHPREVFREAVRNGQTASVILCHNHPTGEATPSKEDLEITCRLIDAGRVLGIRVTDHVIIGRPDANGPGYVSLREKNLVAFD